MIYFITAIGTDSGKTLVSAIFAQALGAAYWKPVQAGLPKDSETVRSLVSKDIQIFPETYFLNTPASPHAGAKLEGISIDLDRFAIPSYTNSLIIEGAGGLLVPLNDEEKIADLIKKLDVQVVLVIDLYLGCINHSLLTLEALANRNIKLAGLVFNGEPNPESEQLILKHTRAKCILRIGKEPAISPSVVNRFAFELLKNLEKLDIS